MLPLLLSGVGFELSRRFAHLTPQLGNSFVQARALFLELLLELRLLTFRTLSALLQRLNFLLQRSLLALQLLALCRLPVHKVVQGPNL